MWWLLTSSNLLLLLIVHYISHGGKRPGVQTQDCAQFCCSNEGVHDHTTNLDHSFHSSFLLQEHRNDPEKLLDLHYNLANSYANSPELRFTWLESMAKLHLSYGNHSEVSSFLSLHLHLCFLYSSSPLFFSFVSVLNLFVL